MAKTNIGLVEYAKSKLNLPTIYMLSGFGRVLTEAMIQKRLAMGCEHTNRFVNTIRTGIGKYCFDCGGIIKAYLWEVSPGVIDYNVPAGSDQNSNGMYKASNTKGPMSSMPDTPGLLVFTADLGHVGIYIGRDSAGVRQYIEASPAFDQWRVFQSNDNMRTWSYWAKYALVQYIEQPTVQIVEKIVYVDKIVQVDRPIDTTMTDGSLTVHITRK